MSVWQGRIRDPGLLKAARRQIFSAGATTVTPSQLESYLQCGYRYFVSNLLRMEPFVAPQEELNSLELGLLVHRVLSRFFGNGYQPPGDLTMAEGADWTEQQLSRMSRILRTELERVRPKGTGIGGGVFLGSQLNALERGLDGSLPRGLLAEFVAQQWKRRRSSEVEAVELAMPPVPLGTIASREGDRLIPVRVTGTIDRLDRRAHCLVVVDYKTGMDQHFRLHQGWGFQLPLYLLLTASARPGKRVRGAFYLLQLPQRLEWREIELRGEESDGGLGKLVGYYREKALQATRSIYQGEFPITLLPPRQAGCANCSFRLGCHYQPEQAEALRRSGRLPTPETVVKRGHWVGPEEAGS